MWMASKIDLHLESNRDPLWTLSTIPLRQTCFSIHHSPRGSCLDAFDVNVAIVNVFEFCAHTTELYACYTNPALRYRCSNGSVLIPLIYFSVCSLILFLKLCIRIAFTFTLICHLMCNFYWYSPLFMCFRGTWGSASPREGVAATALPRHSSTRSEPTGDATRQFKSIPDPCHTQQVNLWL